MNKNTTSLIIFYSISTFVCSTKIWSILIYLNEHDFNLLIILSWKFKLFNKVELLAFSNIKTAFTFKDYVTHHSITIEIFLVWICAFLSYIYIAEAVILK